MVDESRGSVKAKTKGVVGGAWYLTPWAGVTQGRNHTQSGSVAAGRGPGYLGADATPA